MYTDWRNNLFVKLVNEDLKEKTEAFLYSRYAHTFLASNYLRNLYNDLYFSENDDRFTNLEKNCKTVISIINKMKKELNKKQKVRIESLIEWQSYVGCCNVVIRDFVNLLKRIHFKLRYELESLPEVFSKTPRVHLRFLSRNHVAIVNRYIDYILHQISCLKKELGLWKEVDSGDHTFLYEDLDIILDFFPEKGGPLSMNLKTLGVAGKEREEFEAMTAIRGPFWAMDSFRFTPVYAHSLFHSTFLPVLVDSMGQMVSGGGSGFEDLFLSVVEPLSELIASAQKANFKVHHIHPRPIIEDIISDYLALRFTGPSYFFAFLLFALSEPHFLTREFIRYDFNNLNYWIRAKILGNLAFGEFWTAKREEKPYINTWIKIREDAQNLIEKFVIERSAEGRKIESLMQIYSEFSERVTEGIKKFDKKLNFLQCKPYVWDLDKIYIISQFMQYLSGDIPREEFEKEEEKEIKKIVDYMIASYNGESNYQNSFLLPDIFNALWFQIFEKLKEPQKSLQKLSPDSDNSETKPWKEGRLVRYIFDVYRTSKILRQGGRKEEAKSKLVSFIKKYRGRKPIFITFADCLFRGANNLLNFLDSFLKDNKLPKGNQNKTLENYHLVYPMFGNYDLIMFRKQAGLKRNTLIEIYENYFDKNNKMQKEDEKGGISGGREGTDIQKPSVNKNNLKQNESKMSLHAFPITGDIIYIAELKDNEPLSFENFKKRISEAIKNRPLLLFRVRFGPDSSIPVAIEVLKRSKKLVSIIRSNSWDTFLFFFKVEKPEDLSLLQLFNVLCNQKNFECLYKALDIEKQPKDKGKKIEGTGEKEVKKGSLNRKEDGEKEEDKDKQNLKTALLNAKLSQIYILFEGEALKEKLQKEKNSKERKEPPLEEEKKETLGEYYFSDANTILKFKCNGGGKKSAKCRDGLLQLETIFQGLSVNNKAFSEGFLGSESDGSKGLEGVFEEKFKLEGDKLKKLGVEYDLFFVPGQYNAVVEWNISLKDTEVSNINEIFISIAAVILKFLR